MLYVPHILCVWVFVCWNHLRLKSMFANLGCEAKILLKLLETIALLPGQYFMPRAIPIMCIFPYGPIASIWNNLRWSSPISSSPIKCDKEHNCVNTHNLNSVQNKQLNKWLISNFFWFMLAAAHIVTPVSWLLCWGLMQFELNFLSMKQLTFCKSAHCSYSPSLIDKIVFSMY